MGLHWIDGLIIAGYACAMLALGTYAAYRQKSSDEYFVGNRAMNPWLVGVSMFATLFSTITYLSVPGEIMNHGPVILAGSLAIPLTYAIVGHLMLPAYMRRRVTSAYEILEAELGLQARLLGATLFVMLRLVWMATLIYFASEAMLTMLGLGRTWLPAVTFVTGAVAVGYSSIGGIRAVVVTDLVQFVLLFGGAVLVVVTVTYRLGGFGWFPTQWNPSWDTQPLIGPPTVRVTVFGALMTGTLWWVCTAGADQTAIQRFMATGDAKAARRSFLMNSIAGIAVSFVLAMVGFALLGYYQTEPQRLASNMTIRQNADTLFPYFVSHELPVGLSGLVVSGLFAAAMSSLDSGINSITAVVMTDFVGRFRSKPLVEATKTRISRLMALAIGLVVVTASAFMQHVPGNFLEVSQRTLGLFVAPLFTLFVLALFIRGTQTGAIVGTVIAVMTAAVVALWESPAGSTVISFQYILPTSLAAGVGVGSFVSLLSKEH
jgi:SSS family solute:Na+ symporter